MLGAIAPLLPLFGSASAAFVKLRKDIEQPSRINGTTDDGEKLPPNTPGGLEFRNITFAYPSRPDHPVLKNVSFTCPAGQYTALVGLSGSGKSTIAGLSTRLYDPHQGDVIMDGHNLRDLNVRNLRSFISLVQQEPSLLDRSIVENIALGLVNSPNEAHDWLKPTLYSPKLTKLALDVKGGLDLASAAQSYGDDVVEIVRLVQHAADLADASNFINRLEHGYGTMVGSGGKLVSGGQRQRIALARALIRDPKVLLLDEATASLDSASERRIQAAVENASKGRTLISIAHRLSTIKNADNIIVMNAGEIVEQGSHFELIARNGAYANLVNLQNLRPADDDDAQSMPSVSKMSLDTIEMEKSGLDAVEVAKPASDKPSDEKASKSEASTEAVLSELEKKKSGWQVTKSIGRMVRPNLIWIVLALIAAFIVGCTFTASGAIFGVAIGVSSPCNEPSYIKSQGAFLAGMFFMLAVVELFANALSWSAFGYIAENLLYRIRVLSFRSLFQQDVEWHQSKDRNPSTLLSVITKDAAAIGGFSGSIMGTALAVIVNLVVAIVVSHIIAWKIAIVCLVLLPILLGSGIMQLRTLTKFEAKHADAYAEAVGITVEAVNSMKTVSTLSLEHEVLGTFRRALSGPKKDILTASTWANVWLAISNGVGNMIYAFAYWWGSKQIIAGNNTQTEFLIILVAMMVGASLWGQMFTLAPEVSKAKSAAIRIFNLLDLSPSTSATGQTPVLPSPKDTDVEATAVATSRPAAGRGGVSVTFRDVSFAYPARPEHQILQEMSLTIQPGQFCGLVGPSGAGKSTIMALVQRMYRASSGSVEIDGKDISRLDGTEFRDDMAVVPQDSALFDGSVKFNVGLGARPGQEATDEEIIEACKLANIHETIMGLPDGYDTECGPNGSQLSGGQRQRVAIARALVRKPRLLLLDESTSALDAESEKALQDGLEKAARGITVIAIAHRLHTVRKADVIFVCEGGAVVAKGRHEELMEKSETYRLNAMQQMLGH